MLISLLVRPAGSWIALPLALVLGFAYAVFLLGAGVALGTSEYWRLPQGFPGSGGLIDIRIGMSGYYWFVQDEWRWPLFHIAQANGAGGANAALADPIPVLALAAKLIHSVTGKIVDLYPFWVTGAFALNAAAMAALVRGLGQRSVLAALLAAGIGALAPVVHHRFGHLALMAHWVFIFALAAYAAWGARRRGAAGTGLVLLALCALAFGTHLYLFVITAALAAAFFLQAAAGRELSPLAAAAGLAGVPGIGLVLLWAFGLLGSAGLTSLSIPFGQDSMNLLAPFWPQTSGAFNWTGWYFLTRGSIGATQGQYEGYCYLGLGALVLVAVAAVLRGRWLPGLLRHHWALALALLVLASWAVSNQIYLGPRLVLSYPLPDWLLDTVLGWFRAEGRFFWPVAWLMVAFGVAGTLGALRPRMAVSVAALALVLQWVDLSIWRERLHALVNAPPVSAFGSIDTAAALEAEIAQRGRASVVPTISCNASKGGDYNAPATIAAAEVQLMAARVNARMPAILLGRGRPDCDAEQGMPVRELAGAGLLFVLRQPGGDDRSEEAERMLACRPLAVGWACSAGTGP